MPARSFGIVAIACLLSSCSLFSVSQPDDPLVAKNCTNIDGLLAKNYRDAVSVDLYVISGGRAVSITGPEVTGTQAKMLADLNQACRAMVAGIISQEKFADIFEKYVAVSLSLSPNTDMSDV